MIPAVLGVFSQGTPAAMLAQLAEGRRPAKSGREAYLAPGAAILVGGDGRVPEGGPSAVQRDGVIVVADASLYYRHDLARRLLAAGSPPRDLSAAELILAAYVARGAGCADWLEGDFAFVLWDSVRRQLLCARDFVGSRPLHYLAREGEMVVGSSASEVARHPACGHAVHLPAVAAFLGSLLNVESGACFERVRTLNPGDTMLWSPHSEPRVFARWSPPAVEEDRSLSFDEAAEELRHLVTAAVVERLDSREPTITWLSGGFDSSAVFACGMVAARTGGASGRILPVSMSYPPGDAGREDEIIESIATHWNARVRWQDIREVPLVPDDPESAAGRRDTVYAHVYEGWNRALARRSRSEEGRVALLGDGGDELFSNSSLYFSDLFWRGRWATMARDWYLQRGRTLDGIGRFVLFPAIPNAVRQAANRVVGGDLIPNAFQSRVPSWVNRACLRSAGLEEHDAAGVPRARPGKLAEAELEWLLTAPYLRAARAESSALALDEGIEIRRPLLDQRIVAFAARRPRPERVGGGETKRLLRRAVRGLMPSGVLEPRAERTGTTGSYLLESLRGPARAHVTAVFGSPLLAEAGLVDAYDLQRAWHGLLSGRGGTIDAFHLYRTYQAELWLRQRTGSSASEPKGTSGASAVLAASAPRFAVRSAAMR